MRIPKQALFCVLLVSLGVASVLFLSSPRGKTPPLSFGVLTYTNQAASISAVVVLSNKSPATITFDTWNFKEAPLNVVAQTRNGWTNYEPRYETFETIAVRPRASAVFTVTLPADTVRWQVNGLVQAATPKRRVLLALMRLSPARVSNWLLRRLPPDIRVKGGTFEVPADAEAKVR
jgi:hypothetical protein